MTKRSMRKPSKTSFFDAVCDWRAGDVAAALRDAADVAAVATRTQLRVLGIEA